jgi:acyl CoA:acetate/3-ketoacid CoA transferase alpha subunit|tara:strand:- start:153 stop:395 length:243 start_codon:yes stop_codon:yes gene_type:complete
MSDFKPDKQYHQIVKAVVSKDFKFIHIDAGIGDNGLQRIFTETHEEEVMQCYLYPIIDKICRSEFKDLEDIALTIKVTWV